MKATIAEIEAWFYDFARGLDVAGEDSGSLFFEDWHNHIRNASDKVSASRDALRATIDYASAPGNEDVVAECEAFLARLERVEA